MKVRFSSSLVIRRSSLVTRHLPLLLLLVAVGLTASPALAQTTANWNDGNGNWTTASDWNCPTTGVNCVPNNSGGNTYNVVINSSGGNVTLDHTSSLSSVTINALTLGAGNQLNVSDAESLTVNGNLDNSGSYTQGYAATAATVVTVSGKLTNEATGNMRLYADFSNYQGTMNVGTLANSGNLEIDSQQTMNLTNQPGGVTDIVAGSTLNQYGTFNVTNGLNGPVTSAALANLGSIEGNLTLGSADQALTITPGGTSGGTLTNTGQLNVTNAQQLTVSGNLDNSGSYTQGYAATAPTVVTVIGTLTNEASGTVHLYNNFGGYQGTMTVAGLNNAGTVYIDGGQTLAINPTLPNPPSEGLVSTETNSGTINLAPSYSTSGSTLAFNDGGAANTIKLSGKGSINLYNVNDAITSDGYTLTLENVDNTIQGTGNIGKGVSELINDAGGTILANATGLNNDPAINTPLTIAPRDQFINNGTVHVVTSGFGNPPAPAGNTLVLDLSTTGFEAGFTNNGTVTVDDGSTLQVYFSNKFVGSPEIDNNGAINLGSSTGATMQLNGSGEQFTLESTNSTPGTITLAGGSTLTGVTGTESLINSVGTTFGGPKGSANTIQGNGSITNLFLDNNGAIVANNGVLDIAPNNSGVTNDFTGTMQATSGNTLELDLTKTSYATGSTPPPPGSHGGFENFGTVTAADGGTLEFTDTTSSSTVLIQDSGPTNVGSSTGGTVLLSDQGHGATFDFNSLNGGGQPLTLVNSAIKGVSGDETLINDEVIDGTGTITHLAALTNNGALAASGGTLDLSTINLTNLSGGVLTNGSYELLNNGAQQNATLKLPG
ncbi:MAG: beta strand repeat-containing protein, partial [Terriglobia bacterium]